MVNFPIRKRDFRVRGWSGAFWEPLGRKKEKTKCIYRRVEKKAAAERRFFIKKRNFVFGGNDNPVHLALSRGMWKPCIDDMWVLAVTFDDWFLVLGLLLLCPKLPSKIRILPKPAE